MLAVTLRRFVRSEKDSLADSDQPVLTWECFDHDIFVQHLLRAVPRVQLNPDRLFFGLCGVRLPPFRNLHPI